MSFWLSLLTSSFVGGLTVFLINWMLNDKKEKNQLRVCCHILFTEIEYNRLLFAKILEKKVLAIKTAEAHNFDSEWRSLKKESVFYRMGKSDFETLVSLYKRISNAQLLFHGKIELYENASLEEASLEKTINDCDKVCSILKKYAKL